MPSGCDHLFPLLTLSYHTPDYLFYFSVFTRAACCFQIGRGTKLRVHPPGRPAGPTSSPLENVDFGPFFLVAKKGVFRKKIAPSLTFVIVFTSNYVTSCSKRLFFWLNLALKWSFFCHFCDTPRNWPKADVFVVKMPRLSDFLGSFLRDIMCHFFGYF